MAKPPRLSGREVHKRLNKAGFRYEAKRGAGAHAMFWWPKDVTIPKGSNNPIVLSFPSSGRDADLTGVREVLDAVEAVNKQRPKGANKGINPNLAVELMEPLGPGPKPLPCVPVPPKPKETPLSFSPTRPVVPVPPAEDTNVIIDLEPAGFTLLERIEHNLRAAADPHGLGVEATIDRQRLLQQALINGLTAIEKRISPKGPTPR
jgi:predicted RNA binding protein YcfA (HicA-like mRNA interferase family)